MLICYVPEDPTEWVEVVVGPLYGDREHLVDAGLGNKFCCCRFEHFDNISFSLCGEFQLVS